MIIPEFINACAMMFDDNRSVWLGREYPGRIYGWVAFTTANVMAEIPYALAGGVLFFRLVLLHRGPPAWGAGRIHIPHDDDVSSLLDFMGTVDRSAKVTSHGCP